MFVLSLLWRLGFFCVFLIHFYMVAKIGGILKTTLTVGCVLMEPFQLTCSVLMTKSGWRELSFLSAQNKVWD